MNIGSDPACRHCDPRNRPSRDWFCCVQCGLAGPADTIAAVNIRWAALSTGHTWTLSSERATSS
ncbi:MAG: transposase [Candidatus Latescibacteria bacterium]|nr:transposase [Candidatus Latescibacterota bacterium]